MNKTANDAVKTCPLQTTPSTCTYHLIQSPLNTKHYNGTLTWHHWNAASQYITNESNSHGEQVQAQYCLATLCPNLTVINIVEFKFLTYCASWSPKCPIQTFTQHTTGQSTPVRPPHTQMNPHYHIPYIYSPMIVHKIDATPRYSSPHQKQQYTHIHMHKLHTYTCTDVQILNPDQYTTKTNESQKQHPADVMQLCTHRRIHKLESTLLGNTNSLTLNSPKSSCRTWMFPHIVMLP